MFDKIWAAALAAALVGCTSANESVQHADIGGTKSLVMTGNFRLITERKRLGYPIICSEPSPDYTVAFDKSAKATVKITSSTGTTTEIAPDAKTDESIEEGEGRAGAVLALRDGLYRACEAYANGFIGHDAYSIILSQYGNLLVALVGRSIVGSDGKPIATPSGAINPRQATLSALVVACISGQDPTRAPISQNPLLNLNFCSKVLNTALATGSRG